MPYGERGPAVAHNEEASIPKVLNSGRQMMPGANKKAPDDPVLPVLILPQGNCLSELIARTIPTMRYAFSAMRSSFL
jgi:hypothetical protein